MSLSLPATAADIGCSLGDHHSNCSQDEGRGSPLRKIPPGVGPKYPQVVILVGATGDLSRRKLLPGLFHLSAAGFIPGCRIIGVSLDDLDPEAFRKFARAALDEFAPRKADDARWASFAETLDYL